MGSALNASLCSLVCYDAMVFSIYLALFLIAAEQSSEEDWPNYSLTENLQIWFVLSMCYEYVFNVA